MKVLFISHDATRSGAPLALLQVLNFLKNTCTDIEFELLLLGGGEMESAFTCLCKVHYAWSKNTKKNRFLRRFFRDRIDNPYLYKFTKGCFDCIYANSAVSFNKACIIAKRIGVPIIGHVHEAEYLMHDRKIRKSDIQNIDYFITVSELAKNNLIKNYNVNPNTISIQRPISVWVGQYIDGRVGIGNIDCYKKDEFIVGICADEGWCKALDLLPLVLKNVFERHPAIRCKFVVLGGFSELFQYKIQLELKKMGLKDKLDFIGTVRNPLDYQNRFNIFLLLSREESFSLSAQEAALMYTPIIGFSSATGATEWIKDGAGILVPYMNLEQIADAIYYLYKHENERKLMGNQAHEIIKQLYINDSKFSTIIQVIRKCSS